MKKKTIPIFFAVDDNYVSLLRITLTSLKQHASRDYKYHIYVLHTGLSEDSKKEIKKFKEKWFRVSFNNVSLQIASLGNKLNVRDYYTLTTYYRLILPDTYLGIKKGLYLDSDIVVLDDISKLYNTHLGKNYVGAVKDGSVQLFEEFITYVEGALKIPHENYFNAGILLMNFKKMREDHFTRQITNLIKRVSFKVAQDQDLLNVVCKDKVQYISPAWNTMPLGEKNPMPSLIHYNLTLKPWKNNNIMYEEVFWDYANQAGVKEQLLEIKSKISEQDIANQDKVTENLKKLCLYEATRTRYYKGIDKAKKDPLNEREEILQKIAHLEKDGKFDQDAENDPPFRPLVPGDVDYLNKKFLSRMMTRIVNRRANRYFNRLIKRGAIVIDGYEGIENLQSVKSGAIITSNHFNPFDSIPLHKATKKYTRKKKMYKVIREGNYTFPGKYGQFMRHCNTLPLSSNYDVLSEMLNAVDVILKRGDFILVYAEQSMWWNYRKPKPLKVGAFKWAAKNNVPVIPTFITMRDTDKNDHEGYPIQAYTLHVGEPIYPDPELSLMENIENMRKENEKVWKEIYEKVYGIPLTYTTKKGA